MKIAINKCFGGFGISDEAFELLLTKKGIEFERVESEYHSLVGYDYYELGHAKDEDKYISKFNFTRPELRADPDLIDVIEELGEKSNTSYSEIKIIDIPDDVEWEIHEYDGSEYVAEKHRTWY